MSFRFETALSRARRAASRGRKSGFTLVELLVVISIIGMLMALLLPQIQSARETARGNTCRNNMRSLAVALFNYQTRNGSYPGYMNMLTTVSGSAFIYDPTTGSQATGTPTPVSWAVMIFPDIDRQNLYDQLRMSTADTAISTANPRIYIEQLVCASDPPATKNLATPISYVVNSGQQDAAAGSITSTQPYRDPASSGMFFDNYSFHPLSPLYSTTGRQVVMRDELCRDPKDKTILLTENVDAREYLFNSVTEGTTFQAAECAVGSIFTLTTCNQTSSLIAPTMDAATLNPSFPQSTRINSYVGQGDNTISTTAAYAFCRPSSKHPQLVNIAFAGQNVQAMRDSLSYFVYAKLMASDDRNIATPPGITSSGNLTPFKTYQLNDGDVNP